MFEWYNGTIVDHASLIVKLERRPVDESILAQKLANAPLFGHGDLEHTISRNALRQNIECVEGIGEMFKYLFCVNHIKPMVQQIIFRKDNDTDRSRKGYFFRTDFGCKDLRAHCESDARVAAIPEAEVEHADVARLFADPPK